VARRTTLYLLRHAEALPRSRWQGPDVERPLTPRGNSQADWIADRLKEAKVGRLASSPSLRCVASLQPLSDKLGLAVEIDARLAEAGPADELESLGVALHLAGRADGAIQDLLRHGAPAAVCSHGDLIPCWLALVRARDTIELDTSRCAKGSLWQLRFEQEICVDASYERPRTRDEALA
jgi:8-oxo-dGTP diphosphatase